LSGRRPARASRRAPRARRAPPRRAPRPRARACAQQPLCSGWALRRCAGPAADRRSAACGARHARRSAPPCAALHAHPHRRPFPCSTARMHALAAALGFAPRCTQLTLACAPLLAPAAARAWPPRWTTRPERAARRPSRART
jgi:hypothetical protein